MDRVTVAGDIDIGSAHQLQAVLTRLDGRRSETIVLDLAGVAFADSQLIHALDDAAQAVGDREITLVGARPQVARLLSLARPGGVRAHPLRTPRPGRGLAAAQNHTRG